VESGQARRVSVRWFTTRRGVDTAVWRLKEYARKTHGLGDVVVSGTRDLDVRSSGYDLSCEVTWNPAAAPANVGFEVCRAPGGGRPVAAGAYLRGPFVYVNRRPTINPTGGESQTPVDPSTGEGHCSP